MKTSTFKVEKDLLNYKITLYPSLVQFDKKIYLIDCGYEETFEEFITALDALGIAIEDLHAIIISHDDIDHLGALHLFKRANAKLKIYCSEVEAPSVSGKIKSERLIQAEESLALIPEEQKPWALDFIENLKSIQRVPVDRHFNDNDKIEEDLIIISTPGHTKGHVSLYIPSEALVIANDAIVIEGEELNIANPAFTLDIHQAILSVEKIRDLRPQKIVCYHGGIMTDNLQEKLSALILKYKSRDQNSKCPVSGQ